MKKLGWYVVSAGVAAFVLCGGTMLALNLYVQSRAVQHRIKQALSDHLRMPVELRKTTFTPWDGLRIDGLAARPKPRLKSDADADSIDADSLTADSFRVQFAWGDLLRGKFIVEDVLLDRPRLSWAQDKADRWHLPTDKRAIGAANEAKPPTDTPPIVGDNTSGVSSLPQPSTTPGSPSNHDGLGSVEERATKVRASRRPFSVGKFRLRHGVMDFLNHRRGLLGHFEDVNVDGHLTDPEHANGHAVIASANLPRAGLKLTQLQTEFGYDHRDGLRLNHIVAGLAGGNVMADCHLQTAVAGTPYTAQCRLENVNLDQFIREAGVKLGLVDGRLHASIDLSGVSDDFDRSQATGQLELADTRLRNFPLFQAVGSTLHIEDLRRLQFKTARLDYRLEAGTVRVQPLVLVSSNLQITARGTYLLRADRLDLQARLVIDPAVSRQLPRQVAQRFTACGDEAPGSRYVDFNIGGPLNKPTSNLYRQIVPDSVEDLLEGWFHRRPKRVKPAPSPRDDTEAKADAAER